jgi:cytoskeletal protein CcmA (bactofilin family)
MALWNDKDSSPATPANAVRPGTVTDLSARADKPADSGATDSVRRTVRADAKESLIAAELTVEGKIQGMGNIRLAGRFKGDVQVEGNFSIDAGAHVEGSVQAHTVVVGGELTGNIDKAKHVDVLQSGVVVGDVKADTIAVAAGSRMRGHVEFGWADTVAARGTPGKGSSLS